MFGILLAIIATIVFIMYCCLRVSSHKNDNLELTNTAELQERSERLKNNEGGD